MYGTIRMHQERHFPGRVVGTDLVNPDFAAFARAFGAHGETVERTDEFAPRSSAALEAGRPAVLALRIDPEAINAPDDADGDPRGGVVSGVGLTEPRGERRWRLRRRRERI